MSHQQFIQPHQIMTDSQHQPIANYPPHRHHLPSSTSSPTTSDYDPPTLPRYTSPLNPNQQNGSLNIRHQNGNYINNNNRPCNSPHPLSHTTYADSNPTLASDLPNSASATPSGRSFDKVTPAINNLYHQAPSTSPVHDSADFAHRPAFPRREIVHYSPLERFHRAWTGAVLGDSGVDERHVKKKRLSYLDGLKFFAALIVLNGTLFDAVLTENDYKPIQRGSPLYVFRSTNLGISMLLLLSGRCLIAPLWDAPNTQLKVQMKNQDPNKPLVSWARLTRAMLIRPFRFLLPVIAVAALQWGLATGGDNRATRNCNSAGMTEPYWANIDRFAGFITLLFDLFTYFEVDTTAGKAFGANLWTVPWLFQSSYAVYVTHFMLGNLPSNRYWVYGIMMAFSWTSLNYFALPLTGLLIADMAAHGQTAKLRKMSVVGRMSLRAGLLALAFATQLVPVVRMHLNSALATVNVQSHTEITFADWIFVTVVLFVVETSEVAQAVLSNVVFRVLSKLTAGIYLLAPAIVFTLVPDVALKLHDTQTYQASGVLGLSWLLLVGVSFLTAALFYLVVECPSKLLGEAIVNWVEKLGADPELAKRDAEDMKALMGGKQN